MELCISSFLREHCRFSFLFLHQLLEGNDGLYMKDHTNWLDQPFVARYIQLNPQSWNNVPCLRVEVFGCEAGELSISIL